MKKKKKKCLHLFNEKQLYMLEYAQNRKAFSHCHATYQKELSLLFEKSGNFFHRVNVETGLTPPPLFVFVRYLRNPLLPFHDERTI